jgi:replicative DNA helicase
MSDQTIIGIMMQDRNALAEGIAFIENKADFFNDSLMQQLFQVMQQLYIDSKPVDVMTLSIACKKDSRFPKDMAIRLTEIDMKAAGHAHLTTHLVDHCEDWVKRKLRQSLLDANEHLKQNIMSSLEVMQLHTSSLEALDAMLTGNQLPTLKRTASAVMQKVLDKREGRAEAGISTGYASVDNVLGYLMPSTLNIIAARPAMGKTAFSLSVAISMAKAGKRVLFLSLEMSDEELVVRMLSQLAEVHNTMILKTPARLSDQQVDKLFQTCDEIAKLPMTVIDDGDMRIGKIKSYIQRTNAEVVFIDYLQIITPSLPAHVANQNQFFEDLTRDLKIIAKAHRLPMVVMSQLSRANESRANKRPMLSDLRSSGGIEQNADTVTFLHRPKYYDNTLDDDSTEIIIAKNRNGMVGECKLKFIDIYTTFQEIQPLYTYNQNSFYDKPDPDGIPF